MAYIGGHRNIDGKVIDKYKLDNGNLGMILEDENGRRYAVEFQTSEAKSSFNNLYGLVGESFQGQSESIDKLINEGDYIGIDVSSSKNPLRTAYCINYVTDKPHIRPKRQKRTYYNPTYRPSFSYSS